jgi:hypothetical protein
MQTKSHLITIITSRDLSKRARTAKLSLVTDDMNEDEREKGQ